MTTTVKKWILRPLLILLLSFAVLLGIAVVLLEMEHERLVEVAVEKLNQQLWGEVTVECSSISLFKHFPDVSIALDKVQLFPTKEKKGIPVAQLDRLYVGFSLIDALRQKYNASRLSLHGGHLYLIGEPDGKLNLMELVNVSPDTSAHSKSDTSMFEINLKKISVKGLEVSYLDRASGNTISNRIDKLTASFAMDKHLLTVDLSSAMDVGITSQSDTSLMRRKSMKLDVKANYKRKERLFEISTGALTIEKSAFGIQGKINAGEQTMVDFRIKGDKPDFNLMTAFLPEDVKAKLKPFRYDGRLYFDAAVQGDVSRGLLPLVNVTFGCEDGWFLNTGVDKKVDELGFKGYYTNGADHSLRTSEVHIMNVSARPEKGIFKGNFVIRDFTNPRTLIQIQSVLELKFLGQFFGIAGLQQINGKIKLDMDFTELKDIQLPEQSLSKLKEGIQSKLIVEGLSFRIPGYPEPVRDMNLQAEMKDGRVTVDSASLRIGSSDLRFDGTISDIHAFWRDRDKVVTLTLNASSNNIALRDLFAYDTARSKRMKEEIQGFNVGLVLESSVDQLLHPAPLPKGKFEMKDLRASFKRYPHVFKNLGASVTVNDTTVVLRNFMGMIDKSDFMFGGRVKNYQLWFKDFKVGRTEVAFDFKSMRFALDDLLGRFSRKYIPEGYRHEEANNVWLRAKVDLKYDTIFKFAKATISNVSGDLKNHNLKLKDISGKVRYGTRVLILDTLKGSIGKSDFDINLRFFTGPDKKMRKRTNSFKFVSKVLDADEIVSFNLNDDPDYGASSGKPDSGSPSGKPDSGASSGKPDSSSPSGRPDSSNHAKAFNIFMIPFSDFTMDVDIGRLKYNKLRMKDITARLRMQEDHYIYVDTLGVHVAGGTIGMKGYLNGSDTSKIYVSSVINVDQVDLEKMMIKLDHFGHDVVINKNVKGRLSGQIKSYVQIHPNFVPLASKTKAELNIKIYDGSLVDFAPMQAMATYFKDKNLRLVRFDTLQNKLTFTNGVLDIPSMSINSSLGFIEMSGKQSIDLNMEYYVRVPMKMVTKVGLNALFAGKSEAVDANQIDQIEYQDKDKKVRFMNLKVSGTPEDFKVGLGKDKRKK